MKYKVGDKVKIREDMLEGKAYGRLSLWPDMTNHLGELVTVNNVTKDGCYKVDKNSYAWCDEMLEPAYKAGDEVEVRDHERELWKKKKYAFSHEGIHYVETSGQNFHIGQTLHRVEIEGWNQIRPIETSKMELTLTVDGKQVPISTLSEESLINLHKASKEA